MESKFGLKLGNILARCWMLSFTMVTFMKPASTDPLATECYYIKTDYTKCDFQREYYTEGTAPTLLDCKSQCENKFEEHSSSRCWWYSYYRDRTVCQLHIASNPPVCPETAHDASSPHRRRICPASSTIPTQPTSSQATDDWETSVQHTTANSFKENTADAASDYVSHDSQDANELTKKTTTAIMAFSTTHRYAEKTVANGQEKDPRSAGTTKGSYQSTSNIHHSTSTVSPDVTISHDNNLSGPEISTYDNNAISTARSSFASSAQINTNVNHTTKAITNTRKSPKCRCSLKTNVTLTTAQDPNVMVNKLSLDVKTLSSTRRRKESSVDSRKSSGQIGSAWVIVFSVLFACVVLSDLPYMYRNIRYGEFNVAKRPVPAK